MTVIMNCLRTAFSASQTRVYLRSIYKRIRGDPWRWCRYLTIELISALWYITDKESTHSKVDAPDTGYFPLNERRPFRWQTGWAFLFTLVSLIEKGKQCDEQPSGRNQQSQYSEENHNDFICCHKHHLPSYVFRLTGVHWLGRLPPCHGYFPRQ